VDCPIAELSMVGNETQTSQPLKGSQWDETFALRRGHDAEFVEIKLYDGAVADANLVGSAKLDLEDVPANQNVARELPLVNAKGRSKGLLHASVFSVDAKALPGLMRDKDEQLAQLGTQLASLNSDLENLKRDLADQISAHDLTKQQLELSEVKNNKLETLELSIEHELEEAKLECARKNSELDDAKRLITEMADQISKLKHALAAMPL